MAAEAPKSHIVLSESVFRNLNLQTAPSRPPYSSLHHHNVGAVVRDVGDSVGAHIDELYSSRGGAFDITRPQVGLVVSQSTPSIEAQADYVAGVLHRSRDRRQYVVVTFDELQQRRLGSTQVVPYLNAQEQERQIEGTGLVSYGLPPEMVNLLNNKANFHRLIDELDIEGLEVPLFGISRLDDNFESEAHHVLTRSQRLYETHGFSGRYPLGLLFRSSESSGQYGSARVVQNSDGQIETVLYGETAKKNRFPQGQWEEAFEYVKKGMSKNLADATDSEIVISRYIQVADSPGLAFFINGGQSMALDWNKQVMNTGETSCKGTTGFKTDKWDVKVMQRMLEEQSQKQCVQLIEQTADLLNLPLSQIMGTLSFDLMLPGPLERELLRAQGKQIPVYLAECNARFTNRTRALIEAHGILSADHAIDPIPSVNTLREVAAYGVETRDVFPLGKYPPAQFRYNVYRADQKLARRGEARAFISMLGQDFAGVLLLGKKPYVAENVLIEARELSKVRAA